MRIDIPLEQLHKDPSLVEVVTRLLQLLGPSRVAIADDWEADLCAVGLTRPGQSNPLVYISTYQRAPERYWVALEGPPPSGSDATYSDAGKSEVGFEELSNLVVDFLRL